MIQIRRFLCRPRFVRSYNPLSLPPEVFAQSSAPANKVENFSWYSSDWADMELPGRHRFPIEKYTMAREILEQQHNHCVTPGPLATVEEACLAHSKAYVEQVVTGMMSETMRRRVGFKEAPMRAFVMRSLASLGATVAATRHCLRNGGMWSGAISGGTHHAFADSGEGFCVFNDVAVAARLAQHEFGIDSVMVVDLDVHQGNGTAKIFENDPHVYTFSMHQAKGFPFSTRCTSDTEISLPDGCDDDSYLRMLQHLPALVDKHRPGLIVYQAGVDGLANDRFGRLQLTRKGLKVRNEFLYDLAISCRLPVVITMGGGYHRDIKQTVDCSVDVYLQAKEAWMRSCPSTLRCSEHSERSPHGPRYSGF